jgi:hypothetical protein
MTGQDKQHLLNFVHRMGMFIFVQDKNNIVSYLHGYEEGRLKRCLFSRLLSEMVADKYSVRYSSDGWWGQLDRLSKELNKSWEDTFRLVALEILEPTANSFQP